MIRTSSEIFRVKPKASLAMKAIVMSACVVVAPLTLVGWSSPAVSAATSGAVTVVVGAATSTPVDLGRAKDFSLAARAAATLPGSEMWGEAGGGAAITVDPNTKFHSKVHTVNDAETKEALDDATTAYNELMARPVTGTLSGNDLGGQVLTPGVYRASAYAMTSPVTFDAMNDPNAVFVLQSDGALNTTASTTMNLVNGADPSQIFWVTTTTAVLGASSTFYGTMLAGTAITIGATSHICGRAFSTTAAVTLDADFFCKM